MTLPRDPLLTALRAAPSMPTEAAACTALFRQARAAGLLGRVAANNNSAWPAGARGAAVAAARVARAQHEEIRREVRHLIRALAPLGAPVVLLKGAAYVMAGLPAAQGRVFSDIDILVPSEALGTAESLLALAGWWAQPQTPYDERYYREWMHELPPMQHQQRGTTLDVHHTILPLTAKLRPDPRLLFAHAVPLQDQPGMHVLAPADMVLHSMTHLFTNDDMDHALRDLSDLDLLLRHFAALDTQWWQTLPARASALDLRMPLYWGLRCCRQLLGTPVPPAALTATSAWGPAAPWRAVMAAAWRRAIASPDPGTAPRGRPLALALLYLRGHWLRMPPGLLMRHLTTKALRLHQPHDGPPAE